MFQSSLRVFKESQGEHVDINSELELKNREEKLQIMINYKNNLHKLANNSNISTSTINRLLISSNFDSALRSYFQRTIVTTVDRFKAKSNNKECIEFNKPLAGLPRYRKINKLITLEFTNQSYRFLRNNKNKVIGIKLGKTFQNISLRYKFPDEFLNNDIKINNIALTPVSENSIVDGKFYLLIN